MAAEFPTARALHEAAQKIRDKGFKRWDVHSPFPIHGMDAAMGLGKSTVSRVVLACGVTGLAIAFGLQYYTSVIDYPVIVNAKPVTVMTIPAFIPIMFELTVLLSAFGAVLGMLAFNLLPRWHHPIFNWDRFAKVTDDGFFVVIEARDPQFEENKTRELLTELGGKHVTLVHD